MPAPDGVDASLLAALAEPNRLRIVELLHTAPRPVGEIASELGLRQPQVTKHLQTLERTGLVRGHALGRRRVYALRREALRTLAEWAAGFADPHASEEVLIHYQHAIDAEQRRLATDRGARVFRLRRTIPATPAAVWTAWTDHRLVRRWWSPQHFDVADCVVHAELGGELMILMVEGDGAGHRAHGRFTDVRAPGLLAFDLAPDGPDGTPMFRAAYRVRFTPAPTRGTIVTVRIRVTDPSPAAAPALAGIRFGWEQALDKLAALLTGTSHPARER
jgi:uncharacterized protein YndB with AHSA1/START domain/DNA-binding transcriptional ArsR family regulator